MFILTRWVSVPNQRYAIRDFGILTVFVFVLWIFFPLVLGAQFNWIHFALPLTVHNVAVVLTKSFGEECVFRVIPILAILSLFPGRNAYALLMSLVCSYFFGMWHEWVFTSKTFLGLGGFVLAITYLRFGGAYNNPVRGLIACGCMHATVNLIMASVANTIVSDSVTFFVRPA